MDGKVYCLIMAGGGGTRFWPLSRAAHPKQFLSLSKKDAMVNETAARLNRISSKENLFVVTSAAQKDKLAEISAEKIISENIFTEPCARNTSACIGYSAVKLLKEKGDGVMVVCPSDAYIKDEAEFTRVLIEAVKATCDSESIITVGIKPTFPSTGYGYIKATGEGNLLKAEKFTEKPDAQTAKKYLSEKGYFWNSGMFVFKASVIMEGFKKYLPDVYKDLTLISDSIGTADENKVLENVYPYIRAISIDYGVMEKADNISVIPGDFGWNDVGSFDALGESFGTDENGNYISGDALAVECKDCVIYSSGRFVSVLGLENVVVAETPDAVLVLPKEKSQEVKRIVDKLKLDGRKELL